jgi:LPS-assembly protein
MCLPQADRPPQPESPSADASAEPADADKVEITAGRVDLSGEEGVEFYDQVVFRFGERSISAERATFDREDQSVEVHGTVTYQDPDLTVYGEDAEVDTEGEQITFIGAGFDMPLRPARGSAEQINIRGDRTIAFSSVSFTTCPQERPDWELTAAEIEMDVERGFGSARGVKLDFKGVPILFAPYMTFPIDDRRKSGVLTPSFSERDRTGLDISVPYYLNLAPNYDMTIEPRYMSDRGVQVNTEFRYLFPSTNGQVNFEYLPDDSDINQSRRYLNLNHETLFGAGWRVFASIQEVSDDAYFEDLGNSLSAASQTHLDRYVDIGFRTRNWSLLTRLQAYQTIDPLIAPQDEPYQRTPQIVFSGRWLGNLVEFASDNELVRFDREVGTTGWRMDATEEISLAFRKPGMHLTPALALRQTTYWLEDVAPGRQTGFSRTLPVASIDGGLRFERVSGRRDLWLQTLEPRVLYVHVPFEDQSEFPVFDTIEPDFNLVQLFRKYQFLGADRIADTDQLSFGVTSRLIDSRTGQEKVTATLGQTRYLSSQGVSLPDQPPSGADASDYIAEVSINVYDAWNLAVDYQWNSETRKTAQAETRFQYRPETDRLLGFAYRYRDGLLEQGDVSLVWPIGTAWRVIGRYSYSFLEEKGLERFLGWEYESCCWRLRLIGRRYISRRTGESDSSVSIQLQLRGFSDDGDSPEELLDRGILGYQRFSDAR